MNLAAYRQRKFCVALLVPLLLAVALWTLVGTRTSRAAVNAQPVRAHAVQGSLPGGQLAQIWLGLAPEFADAQIKVLAEWDRLLPAANGLNFFIFDEQQLRRLDDGRTAFSAIALAAGNPRFELSTPDNTIGASFNATGWATYAIVLVNESATDATFTLRVTNGFILDTAAQVTALGETSPTAVPASAPTVQPPTTFLTTPGFITTTALLTTWSAPAIATPVATIPVATKAVTTPVPTTPVAATVVITPVITPQARTGLAQNKRTASLSGTLTGPATQQVIRLKPTKAKGQLLLRLVADEGAGAAAVDALNFWVFDETGFSQYLTGSTPSQVAMSAGKRVFRSTTDERVAGFRADTIETYTVVIYSAATLPVRYTFRVEGAQVIETFYLP